MLEAATQQIKQQEVSRPQVTPEIANALTGNVVSANSSQKKLVTTHIAINSNHAINSNSSLSNNASAITANINSSIQIESSKSSQVAAVAA